MPAVGIEQEGEYTAPGQEVIGKCPTQIGNGGDWQMNDSLHARRAIDTTNVLIEGG